MLDPEADERHDSSRIAFTDNEYLTTEVSGDTALVNLFDQIELDATAAMKTTP